MAAVLDFNQDWEFCLDSDVIGLDKRWYVNKPKEAVPVTLPHTWKKNSLKSNDNVGYYFKTFSFEDPTQVKKVMLKLEKVFMQFSIWSNGVFVKEVIGGYQPSEINLTKFINTDQENTICIRVSTLNGTLDFEGKPSVDIATGSLFDQSPFGGVWGNVELVYWKKACILDVNVIPDYDAKKIRVETRFSNSKNFNSKIHYIITSPDGMIAMHSVEAKLEKENMVHKAQFNIKEPIFWTLEEPELYTIEVYLDMSFGLTRKFGIRKSDVLRGDFYLNDKIIKIKGINFTPSYIGTAALPESVKSLREEITTIKKLGFNLIKSGGAPLSSDALHICDEIGLFVIQEMPIYKQKASKEALEYARIFTDLIINYQKTHPSIIAWSLGSDNGTLMLENGTKLLKHTDKVDETRVIFSNLNSVVITGEGEYKSDTGKILAITNEKVSLYNSYKIYPEMNIGQKQSHFLNQFCNKGSDTVTPNKNFGDEEFHENCGSLNRGLTGKILVTTNNHVLIPDIKEVYKQYKSQKGSDDYKKLFAIEKELKSLTTEPIFQSNWDSYEEFVQAANAISIEATINKVNSIRSNEQTSGYIIENWADTKLSMNGLADATHTPKCDAESLKTMTSVSQVIVHNLTRSISTEQSVSFDLTLLNEVRVTPFSLTIKLLNKSGNVVEETTKKVTPEGLVFPIGSFSFNPPSKEGVYTLTASIDKQSSIIGTFSEEILVLKPAKDVSNKYLDISTFSSEDECLVAINKESKTIIATDLTHCSDSIIQALFDAAETGTKVLFNNITPADAERINKSERLTFELVATPSSGSITAAYHYFGAEGLFQDIKHTRIADSKMGDVIPAFSLAPIQEAKIEACCLLISEENSFSQFVDIQTLTYGTGSICFNQYQLIDNLDSNIVAQSLIANSI